MKVSEKVMKKTNETNKTNATTKTNATKTNEKVNDILSLIETKKLFVECGILPKYSDNVHYVGCGTRANVFSVNVLKTRYNVYCNDAIFDTIENAKIDNVTCLSGANSNDKTRPNTLEITDTTALKTVLKTVLKNYSQFALVQ
jgi:hypothetical protein